MRKWKRKANTVAIPGYSGKYKCNVGHIRLQLIYSQATARVAHSIANMDSTYPLVPTANFLACTLVIASVSKSMFQLWNVGVCSLAIWVAILSFITAVDSVIWSNSDENLAPIWCDIGECPFQPLLSA